MKKGRNKGNNKGNKGGNTNIIKDLSELKSIVKSEKIELMEEFEVLSQPEIELEIKPITTKVVFDKSEKITKAPSSVKPSSNKKLYYGVVVDITTTKVHNEILTLMIGTKQENGRPETIRAHKTNLPKGVNFEVNDKVSFEIQEYRHKSDQYSKKNACNVELVAKGNAIMDKLIEKLYGSKVVITYSEGQLKTLATECASQAKNIDEMIKAIENSYKIKFIGKTSTAYVRFAFEDLG